MISFLENIVKWKNIRGYNKRKIYKKSSSFDIIEYSLLGNKKHLNKKIVFFSDLHIQNTIFNQSELIENINSLASDWIIYGGDLLTYLFYSKDAQNFLSKLVAKEKKLAVLGNWEKRRLRWISLQEYINFFEKAGFILLTNSEYLSKQEYFVGLIPGKNEYTNLNNVKIDHDFKCVISHKPNDILAYLKNGSKPDLVISGHTHGGQIRIPGFGALYTSSKTWKLFEYGQYFNRDINCNLIVSSGLGYTGIKKRLFCNPEILLINY